MGGVQYFDTSAVVKLLLNEPESDTALELLLEAPIAVSSATIHAEGRAAIAAAHRDRRIDDLARLRAVHRLDYELRQFDLVDVDEPLARQAGVLADRHRLRGYDAIHLATATLVATRTTVVVSWDAELRRAALEAGLNIAPA